MPIWGTFCMSAAFRKELHVEGKVNPENENPPSFVPSITPTESSHSTQYPALSIINNFVSILPVKAKKIIALWDVELFKIQLYPINEAGYVQHQQNCIFYL